MDIILNYGARIAVILESIPCVEGNKVQFVINGTVGELHYFELCLKAAKAYFISLNVF